MSTKENWTSVITPRRSLFDLRLKEVARYWELCLLFVRRDFVAQYKQTILGPIWFFIQPLFTAYTYFVVLSTMGGLGTDGLPPILFYISGITIWTYFKDCFTKTANTFTENSVVFGKVYFPRLITPISVVISQLIKLAIQMLLLICFIAFFHFDSNGYTYEFRPEILFFPVLIVILAIMSLSMGLIISSLTTKYRDFQQLMSFGVQLLMYFSGVILSSKGAESIGGWMGKVIEYNPIAQIVEAFKVLALGHGDMNWGGIVYATVVSFVLMLIAVVMFNRTEQNFMDTV